VEETKNKKINADKTSITKNNEKRELDRNNIVTQKKK
jgi:hypothetical protein|tara:strand:- start:203 stop:313 length:111 start_codon:yes stop_codon:yes gene_type:complete